MKELGYEARLEPGTYANTDCLKQAEEVILMNENTIRDALTDLHNNGNIHPTTLKELKPQNINAEPGGQKKMEETKQTIEHLKSNSFTGRYAGVGTDFKIYFDTEEELKKGIDAIIEGRKHLEQGLSELAGEKK